MRRGTVLSLRRREEGDCGDYSYGRGKLHGRMSMDYGKRE